MLTVNIPDSPVTVYYKGDLLIAATQAFSSKSVLEYAENQRNAAKFSGSETDPLGAKFAGKGPYNGLILNIDRLRGLLGPLVMGYPQAQFLNNLTEASLEGGIDGSVGHLSLLLNLKPTANANGSNVVKPSQDSTPKAP